MTETVLIIIAVLLRIFSNPFANVFQKQLTTKGANPLLVNFLSYALLASASLFFVPFIAVNELPKPFWLYSIFGGITGALRNGFLVKALQKGDLSVLGPINSYKSVIGIVAGIFLLGEIPNVWGVLGVALIIYGSYFVLDTTAEKFSIALLKKSEIQFRIWALMLTAVEAVFIKKIILASNVTPAFFSWCFFGAVFSFIICLAYRLNLKAEFIKITHADFGTYALLITCLGTMQFTTNYVFNRIPVGYALSLFQLSTIISVLLGYRIFKEQNIRKKLIGSIIMLAGSVAIIVLKDK